MIIKPKKLSSEVLSEFRRDRGQYTETPKQESKRPNRSSKYEKFYAKYLDLENTIDTFGTLDLVYYFREIANENGHKYVISNLKKDMAIMKRLCADYSVREICGMIEFLFESEQDYLDKNRLSINLLASQWINTIYADMKLWIEDKYVPKSKKTKHYKGEWSDTSDDSTTIGLKL